MDVTKRKAIEAAGWKVGDAADFLAMSDEERQLLDMRVKLALAVRRQRESLRLSQKQLGTMLKTSQPRVAKIERAASDVSMDQLVRAFTAVGGKIVVKAAKAKKGRRASGRKDSLVLEVTTSAPLRAEAASKLIESLSNIENAAVVCGPVILVKRTVDGHSSMFIVPLVPQIRKLIEANPLLLSSTDQFFVALEGFRNSELHKLPNLKEANRKIGIRLASKTSP